VNTLKLSQRVRRVPDRSALPTHLLDLFDSENELYNANRRQSKLLANEEYSMYRASQYGPLLSKQRWKAASGCVIVSAEVKRSTPARAEVSPMELPKASGPRSDDFFFTLLSDQQIAAFGSPTGDRDTEPVQQGRSRPVWLEAATPVDPRQSR
jgi:hypothetical protein